MCLNVVEIISIEFECHCMSEEVHMWIMIVSHLNVKGVKCEHSISTKVFNWVWLLQKECDLCLFLILIWFHDTNFPFLERKKWFYDAKLYPAHLYLSIYHYSDYCSTYRTLNVTFFIYIVNLFLITWDLGVDPSYIKIWEMLTSAPGTLFKGL